LARIDPSDDARFYAMPRKVVHLEPGAIEALRGVYAENFPAGATVLDLTSSRPTRPTCTAAASLATREAR
jgi:hypothetical protein